MLLIVSDASVLIDIECGRLTTEMFKLSNQFSVPDTLFDEELKGQHDHLLDSGLIIRILTGELVQEAYDLHQKYKKPSTNDMLALVLAKHEGCRLLTSDKALREVAQSLGVIVSGTIWLIEQMIDSKIITVDVACVAFQHMKDSGSRLPWPEAERMLKKIR